MVDRWQDFGYIYFTQTERIDGLWHTSIKV